MARARSVFAVSALLSICAGGASLLGGCRPRAQAQTNVSTGRPTSLTLTPCRPHGANEEVRCGTLDVAEDRAHPNGGKRIALKVAVVPALAQVPDPDPIFFLAGGPGQSAVDVMGLVLPSMDRLHRKHDLVFVDQRGTGSSSPLACGSEEDAGLQARLHADTDTSAIKRCLVDYQDAGIDPSRFTTSIAMDDLDDVRAALGYDKIDLFGVSYGTRAALVYIRQHPEHARSAVLDSVDPPSMSLVLSSAGDAQRALDKVFDACAADAKCAATYPDLRGKFVQLLTSLADHPVTTTVADPVTGAPSEISLTRETFVTNLHGILYSPEISALLPLVIDRASKGDFAPFVAQAVSMAAIGNGISRGMFFSVVCAEDAPPASREELHKRTNGTYLGSSFGDALLDVCAFWPKGAVLPDFHDPVASNVPVLLLSGDLDPITPPARAEEARTKLTASTAIVVPGTGHNTAPAGCVPKLVAQFVDQGNANDLPVACVNELRRPPFFVTFAGPTP